ncbi:hypothetical protein B0H17DRAFT_874423, partial [Mycena rosella]
AARGTSTPLTTRIRALDAALPQSKPTSKVSRMYEDLTRPQCNVFTQLRTSHIGLNAFLYRFHLAPSPDCPLCLVPETMSHFLLTCPLHRRQR